MVRKAGSFDEEIAENIARVARKVFTNYFNVAADVTSTFQRYRIRKSPDAKTDAPGRRFFSPR